MDNQNKNKITKEQYSNWGKLGGRPEKEIKLNKKISIRLSTEDLDLISQRADSQNLKLTEYCRIVLSERKIPNVEQNKTLLKYAHNFTLISNYMKMGIFNESEKKRLLDEIEKLIVNLRDKVEW